ncbi:phage tail protein [Salmonella enterica subsp. enterica serovar Mountpleasant]|nr:phage tail protein [Salmonella enterica subsp. enterica serovar Mountpleasant]
MTNNEILAHARQCAPAESCGYVVRTAQGERYFPCENLSAEPTMYFRIAPEAYLKAQADGEVVALVHSHPDGEPYLSSADRTLQLQTALPWWLVTGDLVSKFRCVPYLTGRPFTHGVYDCYSLIRDAYHLAGIELPDFHRDEKWWASGADLYMDNLEKNDFYPVSADEVRPGDVLIFCCGSAVANHAAVYCGNGEILHQVYNQLSRREDYTEKWQRRMHSIWRHKKWCASAFTGISNDLDAASACV